MFHLPPARRASLKKFNKIQEMRRINCIWILYCIAAAIIFVIPAYPEESCIYCHSDSSFTVVYDSSSHGLKGVSCNDCHVKSASILGFLGKKYLDMLTFSFKNAHTAERAATENCLKCHQAINHFNVIAQDALPEPLQSIGMVIEHQKHFNLRDSCMTCHASGKFKGNKALQMVSHSDPMGCAACHINISHEKTISLRI